MQVFDTKKYINKLTRHYESYFGVPGKHLILKQGPTEKLNNNFFVLEFSPNKKHEMFAYCTVGMSGDRVDDNLIEIVIYSAKSDKSLVELLTICASYHRNVLPLNLHHTVNIGQSWLDDSICEHGFISLPYLDGQELEMFNFDQSTIHCYWFIPITEKERDYKVKNGTEALEQLFENSDFDYLNSNRRSLIE